MRATLHKGRAEDGLHVLALLLVILFKSLFLGPNRFLVLFEVRLASPTFFNMVLFESFNALFQLSAFISFDESVFLLPDGSVSLSQEHFDLLLVGILDRRVHLRVLFVFAVQVEDDLGELGDLFAHLVVGFLANCGHHVFYSS